MRGALRFLGSILIVASSIAACTGSTSSPDAGQCRVWTDCSSDTASMCGPVCRIDVCVDLAGGQFIGMGQPQTCTKDADCGNLGVCWICPGGVPGFCADLQCTSDKECGDGSRCDATRHCVPVACNSTADCPSNFACVAGACQRRTCSTDAECLGYCVEGWCSPTLGHCDLACG